MQENALIVASLLTWSRDPSPLLLYPSVYSCCLATNEVRRFVTSWLGSARLFSARRKHRFVYCCIIAGACLDVTVLAWRKYATIFFHIFCGFLIIKQTAYYAYIYKFLWLLDHTYRLLLDYACIYIIHASHPLP
jgi:hypothetical protein